VIESSEKELNFKNENQRAWLLLDFSSLFLIFSTTYKLQTSKYQNFKQQTEQKKSKLQTLINKQICKGLNDGRLVRDMATELKRVTKSNASVKAIVEAKGVTSSSTTTTTETFHPLADPIGKVRLFITSSITCHPKGTHFYLINITCPL
jgi:hypothetical protein